jgi:hypothetical protein
MHLKVPLNFFNQRSKISPVLIQAPSYENSGRSEEIATHILT